MTTKELTELSKKMSELEKKIRHLEEFALQTRKDLDVCLDGDEEDEESSTEETKPLKKRFNWTGSDSNKLNFNS